MPSAFGLSFVVLTLAGIIAVLTMTKKQRTYDHEYKIQAVKLAQEIGSAAAARELGISRNTVYT